MIFKGVDNLVTRPTLKLDVFKSGNGIYCLGLFLWISVRIVEQSMLTVSFSNSLAIFKALELVSLLIVVIYEIASPKNKQLPVIAIIFLVAVAVLATLVSQRLYLLQLFVFIVVGRNCELRDALRWSFYATVLTCALIVTLSLTPVIENYVFLWGGRERLGLGFKYATYLPAFAFSGIVLFGYVYKKQVGCAYIIICILLELALFKLTDSRFLCLLGVLAAIAMAFAKYFNDGTVRILRIVPVLFLAFPVITVLVAMSYDPNDELLWKINSLLSSRLQLSYDAIETWGFQLLGQDIEFNAVAWESGTAVLPELVNVVDCSYISSLLTYGYVVTAVFMLGYAIVALDAITRNDAALLTALMMAAIMGLIEPRLLVLEYNPFILSMGVVFGGSCISRMAVRKTDLKFALCKAFGLTD